jgi:hypothetical protein
MVWLSADCDTPSVAAARMAALFGNDEKSGFIKKPCL